MSTKISNTQLIKQLGKDLWGKDSQRGYSFTYSWMANQLGHISLGFIPSCFIYWASSAVGHPVSALIACLSVAALWTIFEFFNCLGSILKTSSKGAFKTPISMVVADTATDVFFFYNGVAWVLLGLTGIFTIKIIVAIFFISLLFIGAYWLKRKMYAWQAGFATQFRLAQFSGLLAKNDIALIEQFMKSWNGKHLIVSGEAQTGKTLLATGIGTEIAFSNNAVIYKTLYKWLPEIIQANNSLKNTDNPLWSWREASLVVIDDVAPSVPTTPFLDPSIIKQLLESNYTLENNEAITQNGFIWVIANQQILPEWFDFLKSIGIKTENILQVNILTQ